MLNQIRESKLITLKRKIKEQEYCNKILKKKFDEENWEQLVELDYVNKH